MDKRWILILIILIAGLSCMYWIVDSSTTVGSAIAPVNRSYITLPDGFSIAETKTASATIIDKSTNEKIFVKDIGKEDSALPNFNSKVDTLMKSADIKIISNASKETNGITYYQADYQNTTGNVTNYTISYVHTNNHTYLIRMQNYDNPSKLEKDLDYIVNTLRPDYKKAQD